MSLTSGEMVSLEAMKKEFKRLSRLAEKRKKEADEYTDVGSEIISIHEDFTEIVNSKEHGEHVVKKLESLQVRRDRAQKILKKDFTKLLGRQFEVESKRDDLGREIQRLEFRGSLRAKA